MPRYLRTPEEVIRERGEGIFFASFTDGFVAMIEDREPTGRAEFIAWFQQHQPHVTLEEIGPSEFSGFIAGGFTGDLYLDGWRDEDIAEYAAVFEDEAGHSRDERWQVFEYPYEEYLRRSEERGQSCD
jgi:hypothetical protein